MSLRKCKCGLEATTEKELEWFTVSTSGKHGRSNTCKECDNARRIALRRNCSLEEARKYIQKKHSAAYLRKCRDCGVEANTLEDLKDFSAKSAGTYGVDTQCKQCKSIEHKARRYGVTKNFVRTVITESSECSICNSKDNLVYDHCHNSRLSENAFRGVLCQSCNLGLGAFKDSTENLSNAITYLNNYYSDDKNHTISSLK